jgi:hypothetical protein
MTNVCLLLMVQFVELNTVYRIEEFNAGLDDDRSVNLFLSSCSFSAFFCLIAYRESACCLVLCNEPIMN